MTTGVGVRAGVRLGWTIADANGNPCEIVAVALVDSTGALVSAGGGGGSTVTIGAGAAIIGTVLGPLPASPITGQQTLTTAAAALPANALQNGLIVTALSTNTGTVYVGAAGVTVGTGYPLSAGQSMSFAVANGSGIYIIGTNATDKVAFAGN